MKNPVLSASMAFLIRLNYRGDAAVYGQNCGKGDLTLIVFGAAPKVDKNRGKCVIFVYPTLQIRSRAALKVEQNFEKLRKYSTADSKIVPRSSESRTKSSKIEEMFYRRLQNRPAQP